MTQESAPLVVNGWNIYAHSVFLDQLESLVEAVEAAKAKDPTGFSKKNVTKRLVAILKLAFEVIPQDPSRPEYRQGGSLGVQHKHWFRAKFFQQYRLFFRYSSRERTIVLAWVNDPTTKRAFASRTDAYKVFARMLKGGNPPSDWGDLLRDAKQNTGRLTRHVTKQ